MAEILLQARIPVEEDMEVRSVIQQIALEHRRRYGYRRITAELRRRGMLVNRKRVAQIMRQDHLLAIQPRAFVVTTDSDHVLEHEPPGEPIRQCQLLELHQDAQTRRDLHQ